MAQTTILDNQENPEELLFIQKIKAAVAELNDVKSGRVEPKDFDELLNEL